MSAQGSQALEEIHCCLNENRLATEADDVPTDNPMNLDEGYIDVEDPLPSQDTLENKHGKAQRLMTITMHRKPHFDTCPAPKIRAFDSHWNSKGDAILVQVKISIFVLHKI